MHISEGVLSAPVLAAGAALAAAGLAAGLRAVKDEDTPKAAVLSAVFFTASLIHVNIGPSSAHLIMSGLIGLMAGAAAFPVIFLGLLLQGLLFGFGGLTTLGVNTFTMAAPAVLFGSLLRPLASGRHAAAASAAGFACGSLPALLSGALVGISLYLSGEGGSYLALAWAVVAGNLPVALIEGFVCMFCVQFLRKVRPDLLRRAAFSPDAHGSSSSPASPGAPAEAKPSPAFSPVD
ncbi:MAG: cobalt transporter CbiM [Deltaproteobacteria bacterium]|jgi:cobalt/nickel transport system permease protein|nr:cobalt transporter CbiM [Deltaproteobacteria bacterium]